MPFWGLINFLAVAGSVIDFQFATFRTLPRQLHHGGLHPDLIESAIAQKKHGREPHSEKKDFVWDWGINPV